MEYNTVQKKALIAFLKENSARSYTIDEISNEIAVGKSTIYRLIPTLVSCGIVKKFNRENDRKFLYQFIDDHGNCNCHLHMKCTGCGKIVHMKNNATEHILSDIMTQENFSVDKEQTVLFGKCSECSGS
ncbi:MAG: transcriptional repressor [Clostridia bacterium]|nr:transcriptional repressor [Clostridia bacterium]